MLGRLLAPAEFAIYGYTTIGVTVALSIGDLGLGIRLIRGQADDLDLRRCLGVQIAVLALLASGTGLAMVLFVGGGDRLTVGLIAAAILFTALQTLPLAMLERGLAFRAISLIEVGQRASFICLAVGLAVATDNRLAIPLAAVIAAAAGYGAVLSTSRWRVWPLLGEVRATLLGVATEWWQSRVATQLTYAAYPILGGLLFSAREVGLIVLALMVTSAPTLLAPLASRAALPAMAAAGTATERLEIFRELFRALIFLSAPVVTAIFVSADAIAVGAFGQEWRDAGLLIRLECLTTLAGLMLTPSLPLLFDVFEPRNVKRLFAGWTLAMWVATPLMAIVAGYLAPSMVNAALAFGVVAIIDLRLRSVSPFLLTGELWRPLAWATVGAGIGAALAIWIGGLGGALVGAAGGLGVYLSGTQYGRNSVNPADLLRALASGLRAGDAPPSIR